MLDMAERRGKGVRNMIKIRYMLKKLMDKIIKYVNKANKKEKNELWYITRKYNVN